MSYYRTSNARQRSTGFVVVLLMHIVAIYILANSFAVFNKQNFVAAIQAEIVEAPPPEKEIVVPIEPSEIKSSVPDFIPPPMLGFAAEPAAGNAIRQVQHAVVTSDVSPTLVKAKRSSKGLTHPKYPEDAARMGEQGTTELNLNITVSGDVVDAKILTSSGSPRLDDAIMTHAIRHWRFTPCMDHGQAVQCWNRFTFHWNIENAKKKGTWKSVVASSDE